jgi:hypothetical protein
MERIVVTVKRANEAASHDLDLPASLPIYRLIELVTHSLNWDAAANGQAQPYQIEAQPLGRYLASNETLLSAGVVQGCWLIFGYPTDPLVRRSASDAVPSTPIRTKDLVSYSNKPVTGKVITLVADPAAVERSEPVKNVEADPESEPEGYSWIELDI